MTAEFTDAVLAIARQLGVLQRDEVCCGDVTMQQCTALQLLLHEASGVSELADTLGTSVSATTRLVDGLERRGWLERCADPADGRRVLLRLTEAGTVEARRLRRLTEEMCDGLLREIPGEERAGVVDALGHLERALRQWGGGCCGRGATK